MRKLLIFPCAAVCIFTHNGLSGLFSHGGGVLRIIRPPDWLPSVAIMVVGLVTLLLYLQPRRYWAYPLLLAAYVFWASTGRILEVDMMNGAVAGRWFPVPTDHHSLRPSSVEPFQYLCDATATPRGWWLDLEYAGQREPVYVGPFIAADTLANLVSAFGTCDRPPAP